MLLLQHPTPREYHTNCVLIFPDRIAEDVEWEMERSAEAMATHFAQWWREASKQRYLISGLCW